MDMPKPGDAHKRLHKLAGRWEGEETLYPSPWCPEKTTAMGRVDNRMALEGFNVIQDYEQRMGDTVSYRGHGIFSYDAAQNEYLMHWFDSMGSPCNLYRGTFEGEKLTLSTRNPMGHGRAIFDVGGEGTYHFLMEFSQDGKEWLPFMEGSYTRKS